MSSALLRDTAFMFMNHIVNHIPCWTIRRLLYTACGIKIGAESRIGQGCIILGKHLVIGERTIINENVLLDGRRDLVIGNDCSISMYAKIYTGTHVTDSDQFEFLGRRTIIHDNCWIGSAAIILPGSILDDFTVIAANSLFKGVSEQKGIYMGVPADLKRHRNIEKKYKLKYTSFFR